MKRNTQFTAAISKGTPSEILTVKRLQILEKVKYNLCFTALFITFAVLLISTPPSSFAQGGRWQIQYDNEANETLGLNGKTLEGSFATLSECEAYRKSLSAYQQAHSKSVRSNVTDAGANQLPKQPNAFRPAPPPPPQTPVQQPPANVSTSSSSEVAVSSGNTTSSRKVQKKIEVPAEPEQTVEVSQEAEADVPEIVVQTGHLKQVNAVALTPDGRFAVSGGRDGMIKLWDVGSGKEIRSFKGNRQEINSVAISPDGRFAVIGNEMFTHNVQLWDILTRKLVRTFTGFENMGPSVAITPDGQLVVAGAGEMIKVWRTETGEEVRTLSGHTSEIKAVAISRDGRYIVSAGTDKMIKVWDIESGKNVRTLSGHTDGIYALAVSPDGRFIISGCFNDNPKMWDMNTGYLSRTFDRGGVLSLAISPDGKYVSFGGEPDIEIWDIKKGKKTETLKGGEPGWVRSLAYSQDGKSILSGGDDNCVKLWDSDSGKKIWSSGGQSQQVASVAVSPDGGKMIVGMESGFLHIWDLSSGKQIQTIKHKMGVNAVAITTGGLKAVAGGWDFEGHKTSVKEWETSSGKESMDISQPGSYWVRRLALTQEGNVLWSAGTSLFLSDLVTGQRIRSFSSTHQTEMSDISAIGKYALSRDQIDHSQLWNTETGQSVYSFDGYTGALRHNNADMLMMGQDAENQITIKLWDIAAKREVSSFSASYPMNIQLGKDMYKTRSIQSLAISPDDRLGLWSYDNELHLWNIAEGKELFFLRGHTGAINSMGFCPNGSIAYSGSMDGSVRLWNLDTGKEIVRFYSFNDGEWIAITPGGYFDASPKGADYLAVTEENLIYDINRVQYALQNPMVVQTVLLGDEPPTDQTVASVLEMNYAPSADYNIGLGLIEVLLLFLLIWVVPFIIALVDILRHNFTGNNKIVWLLILLIIPVLGTILYFFIGRKQKIK